MFVIFDSQKQKIPIKVWLKNKSELEEICLQQAVNLSNLPFLYKWAALMPDTHSGYGMPIGGVIAAEDTIIPNAVGVDIGCGMVFVETNIPVDAILQQYTSSGNLVQLIIGSIMRQIPTGFAHHQKKQPCQAVDKFTRKLASLPAEQRTPDLKDELDRACYQVGTLGGGNHFIELQTDEEGLLCVMVHSGSRNVGYTICNYFNSLAKNLNRKWNSSLPPEWDLAYLPTNTEAGKEYIRWMNFALAFAKENRGRMMDIVLEVIKREVPKHTDFKNIRFSPPIDCHHNYASLETHYGKKVWVHRKGAISAQAGEMGIIPGAMGSTSYLVRGKGNPESFCSCSHGAGRKMSRKQAKKNFGVEATIKDLKSLGVFLGKERKSDVGEESRFAYKDINTVMANELDLLEPVKAVKTLAVVKG